MLNQGSAAILIGIVLLGASLSDFARWRRDP